MAPSEDTGLSKERDIPASRKQFPKKVNGKVPGKSASLRHERTHGVPVCQIIKEKKEKT